MNYLIIERPSCVNEVSASGYEQVDIAAIK